MKLKAKHKRGYVKGAKVVMQKDVQIATIFPPSPRNDNKWVVSCGWKRLHLLKELQELTNVKKLFGQVSDQIPQESDEMTVEELNCDLDMSGRFINFRSYEDALDALELTTGLMVQAVSLPGPEPEDPYKGVNWHQIQWKVVKK